MVLAPASLSLGQAKPSTSNFSLVPVLPTSPRPLSPSHRRCLLYHDYRLPPSYVYVLEECRPRLPLRDPSLGGRQLTSHSALRDSKCRVCCSKEAGRVLLMPALVCSRQCRHPLRVYVNVAACLTPPPCHWRLIAVEGFLPPPVTIGRYFDVARMMTIAVSLFDR
ncbi:hypothetical protein GGI43DRAFT_282397 [Trichoderma evansii]